MVVQLLLRRKAGMIKQEDLGQFLALRHHLDEFKKTINSENDIYKNLLLMARAAQEYSATGDNLAQVETIAGRVSIALPNDLMH